MGGKLTRRRVGVITGAVIGKITGPAGISGTAGRLRRLPICRLIRRSIYFDLTNEPILRNIISCIEKRKKEYTEKLKSNKAVREKLSELNQHFMSIATSSDPQRKGYDLEKLMYDIFELFDLDPKASFKNSSSVKHRRLLQLVKPIKK